MTGIALIGTAPSSIRLAPYGNPDWKIWGCSPGAYGVVPRADVWFEIHRWEPGQPWFSPEYCKFLADFPGTVWMAEVRPEVPNSKAIPVDYLVSKYGPYFFTSSLAWMMALAIEERPDKIGLWGVDMAAAEEYQAQRQGCHYFGMIAKAMGIEVGVPPESDLFCPPPLYGVSEIHHQRIKILSRRRELEQRVAAARKRMEDANGEILFLNGALDDMLWAENNWHGDAESGKRRFVEPPLVNLHNVITHGQVVDSVVTADEVVTFKRKGTNA
jgi:hypothetical protein